MILKQVKIRNVSSHKLTMLFIFSIIFYNEWLVYKINSLGWVKLECQFDDPTCVKILFVADPQIQGLQFTVYPLNQLFIWDSDRYLQSTFREVVKHFKPDVVLYLGDLTDEGSISSAEVFTNYTERLFDIFSVDYKVQQIWIPGDNDIGDENDLIRRDLQQIFYKVFKTPDFLKYGNITFLPVSGILHYIPDTRTYNLTKQFRVVMSHYSVKNAKVNGLFRPHIFISGHMHESKYIRNWFADNGEHNTTTFTFDSSDILMMDFDEKNWAQNFYEIFVPTCSHRMGKSKVGYGAALVNNRYHYRAQYTIFWSPRRFIYLFIYFFLITFVCTYCISKNFYNMFMNLNDRNNAKPYKNLSY